MSIYKPYFYIIQDIRNGKYYAGAKWAQDANPENFMIEGGYKTSSNKIKNLIKQNGLNYFIVRKVKIFKSGKEAYNYETRFLRKVCAAKNKSFYNGHNNEFFAFGTAEYKQYLFNLIGAENPSSLDWVKEKKKKTWIEKYGADNPQKSKIVKEKTKSTNQKLYSGNSPFNCKKVREKYEKNNFEKYGYNWPMERQEVKNKRKETYIEKYGFDIPLKKSRS